MAENRDATIATDAFVATASGACGVRSVDERKDRGKESMGERFNATDDGCWKGKRPQRILQELLRYYWPVGLRLGNVS